MTSHSPGSSNRDQPSMKYHYRFKMFNLDFRAIIASSLNQQVSFFFSTDLNKMLICATSPGFFFPHQSGSGRVNLSPVMGRAWTHVKDKRRRLSIMSVDLFGSVKPNTKPAKEPHSGLKPQTQAGRDKALKSQLPGSETDEAD